METGSFVRRLVSALYFIVFITLIVVAGASGLFGGTVQSFLAEKLSLAEAIYSANKRVFDWAILIIGSSVPAVTGVLAILKSYYYAERNLPMRLQELIDSAQRAHLETRPLLLASVTASTSREDFLVSPIYSSPLARLGKALGFSSMYYDAKELAASVEVFDGEIATLKSRTAEIQDRKVTSHLIRGAYLSKVASSHAKDSKEWREKIDAALTEYRAALRLRPNDLDSLEGAAAQYHALGDDPELLQTLAKASTVAAQEDVPIRQARALRRIAAVHNRRTTGAEWEKARANLVRSRELLRPLLVFGRPEVLEMAKAELLFGEVQTKREKFSAARDAFSEAERLFDSLNDAVGSKRAQDGKNALIVPSLDKEAPGL